MKKGKETMDDLQKGLEMGDLDELQDDLADQQYNLEERQNFFIDIANEGMEECQDDLDELERLVE